MPPAVSFTVAPRRSRHSGSSGRSRQRWPNWPDRTLLSKIFIHGSLVASIILHKFGLIFGGSFLSLSLPIYLVLLAWLIVRKVVTFNRYTAVFFLLQAIFMLVSASLNAQNSDPGSFVSVPSMILFLVLYTTLLLRPGKGFHSEFAIDIFLGYALFITGLGIIQYFVQFVGIRVNSVASLLPFLKPFLLEDFFNSNPVMSYGSSVLRPNGVFLSEPSGYSQLIVIGAVVEVLFKKRYKFLPIYGLGYLLSFSGTGLISLAAAVAIYSAITLRGAARLPAILAAGIVAFFALSWLAPEYLVRYTDRLKEFGGEGSSAYYRYVAQGKAWAHLASSGHLFYGFGPGALQRSTDVASSAFIKLAYDYGIVVLFLTLGTVISAIGDRKHGFVPLLFLCLYQLGGGAELSPPFIILMAVLCIWARADKPRLNLKFKRLTFSTRGYSY